MNNAAIAISTVNHNTNHTPKENNVKITFRGMNATININNMIIECPANEVPSVLARFNAAPQPVASKRVADNSGYCYKAIHFLRTSTDKGLVATERGANWIDTEGIRYAADATAAVADKTASATVWTATKTVSGLSKLQNAAKAIADARRR